MQDEIPIGLPDKMALIRHSNYLEITRRWFGWQVYFLAFFCVFWDGFLLVWYFIAASEGNLMMMAFPFIHVAVGVGLTYYLIASIKNKTHIFASQEKIAIVHKPLPWFGATELPVAMLKQLYVKEVVSHSKNGTNVSYQVNAILTDGRSKKLLSGLPESEQAQYIEQALEDYLRIRNQPVRGEFR